MSQVPEPTYGYPRLWTRPRRHELGVALSHAALATCSAAVVTYLAVPAAREVLYVGVAWAAAAAGIAGIALHRPARRAGWLAMSVGVALWALGDHVWALYPGVAPFPSPADVFYLLGYVGLAVGLVTMARSHRASRGTLLDALVLATALGSSVWLGVIVPISLAGGTTLVQQFVAAAYPVASLVLLATCLRLMLARGIAGQATKLLAAALTSQLVADAVYAHGTVNNTYTAGDPVDVGWMIAYLLFAAAALHPSMAGLANPGARIVDPLSRRRFFLLMSAAFSGPVAAALLDVEPAWLADAATGLLVLLVAARLAGPVAFTSRSSWRDDLTGAGNRPMFEQRLNRVLARPELQGSGVLVVACDLDHFKVINDSLGHSAGDAVLVALSQRLQAAVRLGDVVARLGGDEFAILLNKCDAAEAAAVIERIATAVVAPITISGHRVVPAMSVGVAVATVASTSEQLLRDADTALYRAKELGRGRVEWFDDSLHAAALERLELEGELRHALETGGLRCDYQPEVDIATGMLFGLESLARWQHPTRGNIPPDRFIAIAEATGQIDALFRQILDMTLMAQHQWAQQLGFHPSVAVNLSPVQLADPRLAVTVSGALCRWGAPPDSVWIEVTESAAAAGGDLSILDDLKAVGVKLAIDDFGTGLSTLARLGEVEWDVLKIDRSFVGRLTTDPQTEHVVRAMVAMAHALGMLTVAEGVETQEQLDCLRAVGCDIAQGYLLARPTHADHAIAAVSVDGSFLQPPSVSQ